MDLKLKGGGGARFLYIYIYPDTDIEIDMALDIDINTQYLNVCMYIHTYLENINMTVHVSNKETR